LRNLLLLLVVAKYLYLLFTVKCLENNGYVDGLFGIASSSMLQYNLLELKSISKIHYKLNYST